MAREALISAGNTAGKNRGTFTDVNLARSAPSSDRLQGGVCIPHAGVCCENSTYALLTCTGALVASLATRMGVGRGANVAKRPCKLSTVAMQADMHNVPIPQLESNIRAAFRQRGVSVHPSLSIRAEIEADGHFIKEQRSSDGELMVRCSSNICAAL